MDERDGTIKPDEGFVPRFSEAPYGAVLGSVAAVMSAIGTVAIGALMLFIVADVIGRNFLDHPITGVAEIAARVVVAIIFLQVAAAILQKRLTRADFLVRWLERGSPGSVCVVEAVFCVCGAVVFGLVFWASLPQLGVAWTGSEFFGVQGVWTIPTWPFRGIIVLGSVVAMLAALYRTGAEIRRFRTLS